MLFNVPHVLVYFLTVWTFNIFGYGCAMPKGKMTFHLSAACLVPVACCACPCRLVVSSCLYYAPKQEICRRAVYCGFFGASWILGWCIFYEEIFGMSKRYGICFYYIAPCFRSDFALHVGETAIRDMNFKIASVREF